MDPALLDNLREHHVSTSDFCSCSESALWFTVILKTYTMHDWVIRKMLPTPGWVNQELLTKIVRMAFKTRVTFSSSQKSHSFSRAFRCLHVFTSSFDWFIGLSVSLVPGFGFGFTTLNWLLLYAVTFFIKFHSQQHLLFGSFWPC